MRRDTGKVLIHHTILHFCWGWQALVSTHRVSKVRQHTCKYHRNLRKFLNCRRG